MSDTATVSKLPLRVGDGYNYGGEWVVTVNGITMIVGGSINAAYVAKMIEHLVNNQPEAEGATP